MSPLEISIPHCQLVGTAAHAAMTSLLSSSWWMEVLVSCCKYNTLRYDHQTMLFGSRPVPGGWTGHPCSKEAYQYQLTETRNPKAPKAVYHALNCRGVKLTRAHHKGHCVLTKLKLEGKIVIGMQKVFGAKNWAFAPIK